MIMGTALLLGRSVDVAVLEGFGEWHGVRIGVAFVVGIGFGALEE